MIRFVFIIDFGIFFTLVGQNHLFGVNLEHVGINQMPILLIVIAAWQPKNQRLSSQVVTSSKDYLVASVGEESSWAAKNQDLQVLRNK